MTSQLKVGVLVTLMALTLSACSTAPIEEMDTNAVASIPESGPLVQGSNTSTVATTTITTVQPQQPNYNTQTQYQPNYTANTYVPAPAYTPPAQSQSQYQAATQGYDDGGSTSYEDTTPVANYGTNSTTNYGSITNYDTSSTNTASNTSSNSGSYDMYDNYGRPKAQAKPQYDYSGSEGYPDSYSDSGSGGGGSSSSGSASGSHAVQVLATGNSSKAQSMRSQMQAVGLSAVVDNVGGLYKVRVPFASRDQASANLARIRSLSGESGAFITTR
ncbi:SPOR domain-containing protein [Thiofilum flexile]|uniref:SPOR domain-containing protein n=1 Tax=Thiofilum flexile TaxID=125627 RepID=UPI0003672262|nr:SPOR domain-containing protein [Thiofilum flexile]